MVEQIKQLVNEIGGWEMKVEYDKVRQFKITLYKPMHCIEIVEMQIDELTEMACDSTTQYFVYRNNELMFVGNDLLFVGNDMYSALFLVLLRATLSEC